MKPIAAALAVLVGCLVGHAHAGWGCTGRAVNLTIDPNGTLYMSLVKADGAPAWNSKYLCNVRMPMNNVDPQVCKATMAMLMTANTTNRMVTFYFDYPNATTPDCSPSRFVSWSALATDSGSPWYYGPALAEP